MLRRERRVAARFLVFVIGMTLGLRAPAQTVAEAAETRSAPPEAPLPAAPERSSEADIPSRTDRGVELVKRFAGDQKAIWSAPFGLRRADTAWALPALAGAGALVASDSWLARQVPAGEIARSRSLAQYGTVSLAASAGGMLLLGKLEGNDRMQETGFLASEAAVNAAAVDFALKAVFQRQRPYDGNGAGNFFAGGSSFPSEHAAISWAIAGVLAHEYPGALTKLFSYGLASLVSVTRVTGKEHFPSEVVIGGALGYFLARQVYQRRRDPEISDAAWGGAMGTGASAHDPDRVRSPRNMGSAYVPPDSWVYPLLQRLAALGYIRSAYLGIRPWTRIECARLLEEAADRMPDPEALAAAANGGADRSSLEAAQLFSALRPEFSEETERLEGAVNRGMTLDSAYLQTTGIAGRPLTDGFHFAQTLVNDYGRPYGEGFNAVSGMAGHGEAGPLSFSFQGEYQQAPAVAPYSQTVQQAIAEADQVPATPGGNAAVHRLQVINSSLGLTFHDLQLSFGKQAEWLGVGDSGPFLASTNAPSIVMFQIENVTPYPVPLLSNLLGPVKSVFFVGQLSGQTFVFNPPAIIGPGFHPQPFIHGNKTSFKPTPNLEFGMGLTAIFGGPGLPFTWGEFLRSYYSHKSSIAENPGKRFSGFDISYRVPGLRQWLTVYNDSMVGDEISPLGSTRPLLAPGLYMPQAPKIPKLELRFEGVKDPFTSEFLPGFVYYDRRYRSGYTNGGNLIGSWVGRDGFGGTGRATYWISPRTKLQSGYRYQEADRNFLEGGRLVDYSLRAETRRPSGLAVSGLLQYEQWKFPLLAASRQANLTAAVELAFYPPRRRRR